MPPARGGVAAAAVAVDAACTGGTPNSRRICTTALTCATVRLCAMCMGCEEVTTGATGGGDVDVVTVVVCVAVAASVCVEATWCTSDT